MCEIKDECRATLKKARDLQAQVGVPEAERCSLPPTFNRLRNEERIHALTAQYEAIIAECEKQIAEHAASKEAELELQSWRQVCERVENHLRELQTELGESTEGYVSGAEIWTLTLNEVMSLIDLDEAAIAECENKLAAKAEAERLEREAAKAAEQARIAADPAGAFLAQISAKAELEAARKAAMQSWQALRSAQKTLDIPANEREPHLVFEGKTIAEIVELTASLDAKTVELSAVVEKQKSQARHKLEAEYRKVLEEGNKAARFLRKRERPMPKLEPMSNSELLAGISEMRGAISRMCALVNAA
jgi:hypothetical protein